MKYVIISIMIIMSIGWTNTTNELINNIHISKSYTNETRATKEYIYDYDKTKWYLDSIKENRYYLTHKLYSVNAIATGRVPYNNNGYITSLFLNGRFINDMYKMALDYDRNIYLNFTSDSTYSDGNTSILSLMNVNGIDVSYSEVSSNYTSSEVITFGDISNCYNDVVDLVYSIKTKNTPITTKQTRVSLNISDIKNYLIYTMNGRLVYKAENTPIKDVHLTRGNYIIQLHNKSFKYNIK